MNSLEGNCIHGETIRGNEKTAVSGMATEVDTETSKNDTEELLKLNFEPAVAKEESAEIVTGSFFNCIRRLMR